MFFHHAFQQKHTFETSCLFSWAVKPFQKGYTSTLRSTLFSLRVGGEGGEGGGQK